MDVDWRALPFESKLDINSCIAAYEAKRKGLTCIFHTPTAFARVFADARSGISPRIAGICRLKAKPPGGFAVSPDAPFRPAGRPVFVRASRPAKAQRLQKQEEFTHRVWVRGRGECEISGIGPKSLMSDQRTGGVSGGGESRRVVRLSGETCGGGASSEAPTPGPSAAKPREAGRAVAGVGDLPSSADPADIKTAGERREGTCSTASQRGEEPTDGQSYELWIGTKQKILMAWRGGRGCIGAFPSCPVATINLPPTPKPCPGRRRAHRPTPLARHRPTRRHDSRSGADASGRRFGRSPCMPCM